MQFTITRFPPALLMLLATWTTPWATASPAAAAGRYTLEEPVTDSRVFRIDYRMNLDGRLETAIGNGKARALDLEVDARHNYLERRLPGAGRDAEALRSLRRYSAAQADIDVAGQTSSSRLRDARVRIVAQGRREGIVTYSPAGALMAREVELLEIPGDSLALSALLPLKAVEVGDAWQPESWVVQLLTGTEAMLKGSLECQLEAVESGIARIAFSGGISGATDGASTRIELSGTLLYDLKRRFVKQFELTQTEKRSVGAVSPGMNVEARVTLQRDVAPAAGPLTDAVAESIPLEPPAGSLQLMLQTPWRVRLTHDRGWRLFHESGDTAVLRLLDSGSLIAQCNMTRIPAAAPGKHTSEMQFQKDVRLALGDRLKSITNAELLEVDDERHLYRVTAVGESNGVGMHWFYYLCAAPGGQQVTFVFAVETRLQKQFNNRDLKIVKSLEFVPVPSGPPQAASGRK